MMKVRYVVCSERQRKPVTRGVFNTRPEAERAMASLQTRDEPHPEDRYWIAETGPEADEWRWLGADEGH